MGSLLELWGEEGGGEKRRERRKKERWKSVDERQKYCSRTNSVSVNRDIYTPDGMQFEANGTKYKYTKPEGKERILELMMHRKGNTLCQKVSK